MNPLDLLEKIYPPGTRAHVILVEHSKQVAEMALAVAKRIQSRQSVDIAFVEEAALLHDIGIARTRAPEIGCHGDLPYLCHGLEGRKLLEGFALPRHALVCERHIGVGLTKEEIRRRKLPLPERDMVPVTLEEQIVAYADLFFSKDPDRKGRKRTGDEVRRKVARFGEEQLEVFDSWHVRFAP